MKILVGLQVFLIVLVLIMSWLLHRDHLVGFDSFRNLGRDSTYHTYVLSTLVKSDTVKPGWGKTLFFNEFKPHFKKNQLVSTDPLQIKMESTGQILLRTLQYDLSDTNTIVIKYSFDDLGGGGLVFKLNYFYYEGETLKSDVLTSDVITKLNLSGEITLDIKPNSWVGYIDLAYVGTAEDKIDVTVKNLQVEAN